MKIQLVSSQKFFTNDHDHEIDPNQDRGTRISVQQYKDHSIYSSGGRGALLEVDIVAPRVGVLIQLKVFCRESKGL